MPPRRGKRQAEAAPASDLKITSLDQNSLQNIINFLPRDDQKRFALAHPIFRKTYRDIVTSGGSYLAHLEFGGPSQVMQRYPNLVSVTLMLDTDNGKSSLYDLKGPLSIKEMNLALYGELPSRRSLSALGINFPNLRVLTLEHDGEDRYIDSKEPYLNSDGSLKVLSSLRNLEDLTLLNLYSDDGLQYLTSLTKLTVSFPEVEHDYPDELYCHGCESIHLDDNSDLQTYSRSIPWTLGIVFGRHIGKLPKLKQFIIDFDAAEGSLSYSAVMNRLYLREPRHSGASGSRKTNNYNTLTDNIHSPPREPRYFQSLEEIEFINCGGPEHFLYTPTMHRRIQYTSEGLASNDFWHTCVIWESMKNFPKLQKWRLHAFDGAIDDGVETMEVNWPCACGCGTVKGQVVESTMGVCGCSKRAFVEINRPEEL